MVYELREVEAAFTDARDAQHAAINEVCELRAAGAKLREEASSLQTLLRAAKATRSEDASIDKQLVASMLAKYFERGSDADVLAVIASMLGCTHEEQRAFGLLPHGASKPHPDAKLSEMWANFLLAEADDAKRAPR